jgi:protein-S-isoprenylcysteine O-methyltransferase Ste14
VQTATGIIAVSWLIYWILLGTEYFRAERARRRDGETAPRRGDNRSMGGMLLEVIAFATVFEFRRDGSDAVPDALLWCGAILALLAVLVAVAAARSLGREFRIQAVVTEDQRLVVGGPYRFVRHPIFASLLCLLLATGIAVATWPALVVAVLLFLLGTEIRIRAEEALLAGTFGHRFDDYRARTVAYIPFVR